MGVVKILRAPHRRTHQAAPPRRLIPLCMRLHRLVLIPLMWGRLPVTANCALQPFALTGTLYGDGCQSLKHSAWPALRDGIPGPAGCRKTKCSQERVTAMRSLIRAFANYAGGWRGPCTCSLLHGCDLVNGSLNPDSFTGDLNVSFIQSGLEPFAYQDELAPPI